MAKRNGARNVPMMLGICELLYHVLNTGVYSAVNARVFDTMTAPTIDARWLVNLRVCVVLCVV